jgi:transposase
LVAAIVHAADVQDRDGAPRLLKVGRSSFPWLRHVFADSAYAGRKLQHALTKLGNWTIEIVRRSDAAKGFVLLPRRWVVEHTLAWLNRNRRLAKGFEASAGARGPDDLRSEPSDRGQGPDSTATPRRERALHLRAAEESDRGALVSRSAAPTDARPWLDDPRSPDASYATPPPSREGDRTASQSDWFVTRNAAVGSPNPPRCPAGYRGVRSPPGTGNAARS